QLLHTQKQDCEAKGVIERWHRTLREEVLDELDDRVVTLDELNAILWAWLAEEYHLRRHDTTGLVPREHFLDELDHLRRLPKGVDLDEVFLHRKKRKVRKDGTVRFAGRLLEVHPICSVKRWSCASTPTTPTLFPGSSSGSVSSATPSSSTGSVTPPAADDAISEPPSQTPSLPASTRSASSPTSITAPLDPSAMSPKATTPTKWRIDHVSQTLRPHRPSHGKKCPGQDLLRKNSQLPAARKRLQAAARRARPRSAYRRARRRKDRRLA